MLNKDCFSKLVAGKLSRAFLLVDCVAEVFPTLNTESLKLPAVA